MDSLSLLHGVRFIDSFFPSGGYAFSSGLETAVHEGAVRDAASLSDYVVVALRSGLGPCDGVAVGLVHEALRRGDYLAMVDTDRQLDAMKTSRELRLASRQMGRQVRRGVLTQNETSSLLDAYETAVREGRAPCHVAVALGAALALAGWSKEQAVAGFLYQAAVGYVSGSFKLLALGQREGQRLLSSWMPLIAVLARQAVEQRELYAWTPLHDVYSMRHARAAVRLFRS